MDTWRTLLTSTELTKKFGGRGSAPPRAYYNMGVKVSDRINLDDIKIGERGYEWVTLEDHPTASTLFIREDGWVIAFGTKALVLMTAAIAFLVRTKIAPSASLANAETRIATIIGRGRRANF